LKQVGINSNTAGHAEINAWEQTDLYYEGGDINEQINWVNQESPRVHAPGVSKQHVLAFFKGKTSVSVSESIAEKFRAYLAQKLEPGSVLTAKG
jgi:hypothetical protein